MKSPRYHCSKTLFMEDDEEEEHPVFVAGKTYASDGGTDSSNTCLSLFNEDHENHLVDDNEEHGNWIQYFTLIQE